jgi:hypothetical protein
MALHVSLELLANCRNDNAIMPRVNPQENAKEKATKIVQDPDAQSPLQASPQQVT